MNSLFFPHFYISNDVLIRHQFLMADTMLRILSSDRPTRDSKEVKDLMSALSFPENRVVEDCSVQAVQRFITILEEAYQKDNPFYFPALQKFGVERTATKTFHFSRINELVPAVEKMQELGFAKPDHAGSWCMSAPKMVQMFVTCATLEYQKQLNIPRCTDLIEHDELASVIEALPQKDTPQQVVTRAVLNFKYIMPDGMENMDAVRLIGIKKSLHPFASKYELLAKQAASALDLVTSTSEIKHVLEDILKPIGEINQSINSQLKSLGVKAREFRGQYRWYAQQNSALSTLVETNPVSSQHGSIEAFPITASQNSISEITSYPGCFVWTLEPADAGKGLMNRLRRMWG